jgi:hypothetical protein
MTDVLSGDLAPQRAALVLSLIAGFPNPFSID